MPFYDYELEEKGAGCDFCRAGFELFRKISDPAVTACPKCGAAVRKSISAPAIGRSKSKLDDRAKAAGFSKLKRLGKGEYEKLY